MALVRLGLPLQAYCQTEKMANSDYPNSQASILVREGQVGKGWSFVKQLDSDKKPPIPERDRGFQERTRFQKFPASLKLRVISGE